MMLFFCVLRVLLRQGRPTNCAFNCPHCKTIRMAKRYERVEFDHDMRPVSGRSWFACQTCQRQFNADAFHADRSGVFELESELIRRRDEAKTAQGHTAGCRRGPVIDIGDMGIIRQRK
jgi:hypothetical protein